VLLRQPTLEGIRDGTIDLVFRRQRRPTVKAGGTLRTAAGVIAIEAVEPIAEHDITDAEARRAGFATRDDVLALLKPDGRLYRIRVRYAGEDPRIALRNAADLSDEDVAAIRRRLERLDRASLDGPWTAATLRLIMDHPEVRAPDLAARAGRDTQPFKADVRKLKNLGLTESLRIGYRLSPRGQAYLTLAAGSDPAGSPRRDP
jgi:predicted transcriptional regulator